MIAAAKKPLVPNLKWKEVDEMVRGELEEKAEFLGLIIMQNSVKEETYPAIKALHDADINTVMVTGRTIIQIEKLNSLVNIERLAKHLFCRFLSVFCHRR